MTGILFAPRFLHAQRLIEVETFGNNPGNLRCFFSEGVLKPDSLARPLVMVLHGCNQNASVLFKESGWDQLSERFAFHVLCPEQKLINNAGRCFNWFLKQDNSGDSGEIISLFSMLQFALKNYKIDSSRVFIYGVSAGAFMSVAFASNFPQYIKAAAICAGGPFSREHHLTGANTHSAGEWGEKVRALHPQYSGSYPRMLILHGTKDKVVKPHSAVELRKQWMNLHGINSGDEQKDTLKKGKFTVYQTLCRNLSGDTLIQSMLIKDMGHSLPVDPGKGERQGGKQGLFTIDKNWFSTLEIAEWFKLN